MKPLLLDVEFPYRVYGIPSGKRNTIPVNMRGHTSVMIDVVDRDAFVAAVTLRKSEAGPERVPYTLVDTMYGYDGTLWGRFSGSRGLDIETFRNECATFETNRRARLGDSNPFRMRNSMILVVDQKYRQFGSTMDDRELWPTEFPFRKIVSSDFEARRADAQRIADSLAVVDSEVWHRRHDPVWEVTDYNSTAYAVIHEGYGFGGFRIDRRRDFETMFEDSLKPGRTRRGHIKLKGPLHYAGMADVHDPSFLNRNDVEHILPAFANVRDLAKEVILDFSAEAINTWAAFREIVARLDSVWSRADFDLALDTMSAMRRDLAAAFTDPDFNPRRTPEVRWTVEAADEVLRRCKLVEGWKPSNRIANRRALDDVDLDALARLAS
jgi:hypothetical protein